MIKPLAKLGFNIEDPYYYYLRFNRKQTFDDSRARKDWNWEPKYNMEKSCQDAMNWFLKKL